MARKGADAFYRSNVTEDIVEELRQYGEPITCEDFAEHKGEKVNPVRCEYGDYDLFELPPNSQGLSTLQLLKAVEVTELNKLPFEDPQRVKEFFKLAVMVCEDRDKYITDPDCFKPPVNQLLSPQYLRKRLGKEPHSQHILKPNATTDFVVGDKYGNIVGFIQSIFHAFGSGIVAQDIPFQSRGAEVYPDSWRKNGLKANIENAVLSHEMLQWVDRVGFQSERMGIVHAIHRRSDGALEFAAHPRGGGVASALL